MGRAVTVKGYDEDKIKNYHKGHRQKFDKKDHIKIARQLCYGEKVIQMIEEAETVEEIEKILHDARLGLL